MRSVTVRLDDLKTMIMNLGFVGENEHTRVMIDAKKMYDQYPHASASLTVCPPSGASYPAVIERDGDMVIWDITDSDLTAEGSGEIQLSFTAGEVVAKTYIGRFRVSRSIIPTGAIPEPLDDFLTRAGAALTAIPETIDESLGQITAEAETLAAGSSATAAYDNEAKKFSFGIPKGDKGDTGDTGAPGYSPSAGVSKSGDTATITITDKDGTTTATVKDGTDGQDGAPGADGYSPSASVSKTGTTATITITDKDGTTSAQISDGDPTALIDDTAGSGDTDKVWSADKTSGECSSLKNDLRSKADVIIATKSGSIVTLTDAVADEPLTDCVVQIVPVQSGSGDPSPSNVRPISGWTGCNISRTGKNLLDFTAFSTYSNWKDNLVGYGDFPTNSTNRGFLLNTKPSVTYTISFGITSSVFPSYLYLCSADGTSSYRDKAITTYTLGVTSYTFTAQDRIYYLRMGSTSTEALFNGQIEKVSSAQLEIGSSASSYEAYQGTTYPISWQTIAGTVFGGSLNVTTGVLTVTHKYVDIGSLNYSSGFSGFYTTVLASEIKVPTSVAGSGLISSQYKVGNTADSDQMYIQFTGNYIGWVVFLPSASYDNATAFKTAMDGVQLVYELATPVTYQLTATEIKTLLTNPNNVFADTGDVSVSYKADTKQYVDQHEGVTDVKIAGSSVVTNGVANVPIASEIDPGVAKIGTTYGVNITSGGVLCVARSSDADVKAGTNAYKPITPYNQDSAAFYGLAKAAGNTDQASSSNAVGTYTTDAIVKIQKMLGIYQAPWELIREDTFTNSSAANHEISVDENGNTFELTDLAILFETPKQENESSKGGYIYFRDGNTTKTLSTYHSYTQAANANAKGVFTIIRNENGMIFTETKAPSETSNFGNVVMRYKEGFDSGETQQSIFFDANFKITKIIILSVKGTGHYKLYGKRKWN